MTGTMTRLLGFSLLLALATLPIRAVPLTGHEPVPCDDTGAKQAAKLTLQHMNHHHYHGYKFNLSEVASVAVKKVESGCVLELHLKLLETVCHFVNPKPFDECEFRSPMLTQVHADCKATVTVANGQANVTAYSCNSAPVPASNVTRMCPDCSTLMDLTNPEGLKAVRQGLDEFHKRNYTQRWKLLEVGRITSGMIPPTKMFYSAEFAIVETSCPFNARIVPEACKPHCPATARYGLCSSTLYDKADLKLNCEVYEGQNSSSQDPERRCERLHHHGHESPDHHKHPHHGDKGHEGHRHGEEGHEGHHGHEGHEHHRHGDKGHKGHHGHGGHEHHHHGPPPPNSTHHASVLPALPPGEKPHGHRWRHHQPRLPPHCQAEKIHPICSYPPVYTRPPPPGVHTTENPRLDQA